MQGALRGGDELWPPTRSARQSGRCCLRRNMTKLCPDWPDSCRRLTACWQISTGISPGIWTILNFQNERFSEVEKRLDLINQLKAKYGRTIELILEQKKEKEAAVEKLLHFEEYRQGLQQKLREAEEKLEHISAEVSRIRKSKAAELTAAVRDALLSLNFLDVQFEMEFTKLSHYTAKRVG